MTTVRAADVRMGGTPAGTAVWGAAVWSTAFGAASLYVALGGRVGSGLVAPALVEATDRGDPVTVTTLWAAGVLKLGAAVLLVAADRWWVPRPRWVAGAAAFLLGLGVAAWGASEGVAGLLVATGATAPLNGWGHGSVGIYYATVWGPTWLVGGALFVFAGRHLMRCDPRRRAHRGT